MIDHPSVCLSVSSTRRKILPPIHPITNHQTLFSVETLSGWMRKNRKTPAIYGMTGKRKNDVQKYNLILAKCFN